MKIGLISDYNHFLIYHPNAVLYATPTCYVTIGTPIYWAKSKQRTFWLMTFFAFINYCMKTFEILIFY